MNAAQLKTTFQEIYGQEPIVVRAPGRINIIGEHTDYNQGFVMPAAIDKAVYVGISKRDDSKIQLYAESYKQFDYSDLSNLQKSENTWANYILGVVDQLQTRNFSIGGFNLYIDGDVPLGAGLSSSAAVECATAYALDQLFSLGIARMDIALISQKAEQVFSGVNCGIMDQFASVFGKEGHAMMLDCRSMEHQYVPLKADGYLFLLMNTNVKHSLADTAYNTRRAQCEQGVAWVNEHHSEVKSLRDVSLQQLDEYVKPKDLEVYTKSRFVIEENIRLQKAAEALKSGDLHTLGQLMFETHEGLSKCYEVSCRELDFLVEAVKDRKEVLGARMMGGGFGGCTLNIVRADEAEQLVGDISDSYKKTFGLDLGVHVVEAAEGVALIG